MKITPREPKFPLTIFWDDEAPQQIEDALHLETELEFWADREALRVPITDADGYYVRAIIWKLALVLFQTLSESPRICDYSTAKLNCESAPVWVELQGDVVLRALDAECRKVIDVKNLALENSVVESSDISWDEFHRLWLRSIGIRI